LTRALLEAPDISCDHCLMTIEKVVTKLPGVLFVDGDAEGKKVTVEYDPAFVSLETIQEAMEEEGYPVKR
jgi:copper chaperone